MCLSFFFLILIFLMYMWNWACSDKFLLFVIMNQKEIYLFIYFPSKVQWVFDF